MFEINTERARMVALLLGLLCSSACAGDVGGDELPSDEGDRLGTQTQSVEGGFALLEYGLVDFFVNPSTTITTSSVNNTCTGSMIGPGVILTAAHCLPTPDTLDNGSANFVIRYFDPDTGLRIIHNGTANWARMPSFDGGLDFPADANDDMGVIIANTPFSDTDYHDYLRLYAGSSSPLDESTVLTYGAGLHGNGSDDNKLRRATFDVENATDEHLNLIMEWDKGLCKGDSGGPSMRTAHLNVNGFPYTPLFQTVAAVSSGGYFVFDDCTSGVAWDETAACRVRSYAMSWIQDVTDLSCNEVAPHSWAVLVPFNYQRCFQIPFIEDVLYEGPYSSKRAIAITSVIL